MTNIDFEKLNKLRDSATSISRSISSLEKEYEEVINEMFVLFPKGYWYTYDIDTNWHHPKKYSVKEVSVGYGGEIYVTVKEVFKKLPWPGFTGRHSFRMDEFLNLNRYKTESEAIDAHQHRACPKCGNFMMNSEYKWCNNCINERRKIREEFKKNHRFYHAPRKNFYIVEYEDELTRNRGYGGQSFTIKRLDTGEVIRTSNLWSDGYGENTNNLPEIEFIDEV